MQSIEWIPLSEKAKWERLTNRFNNVDIYYLHGYVSSFNNISEGVPYLIYYSSNGFDAINVVLMRNIRDSSYVDLTSVYGYGGWVFSDEPTSDQIDTLFKCYEESCLSKNVVSEVIRTHPNSCSMEILNKWYEKREMGSLVNINLDGEDLWEQVPSKSRNVIRKAEKLGVTIENGERSLFSASDFKVIYDETMERTNAAPFYFFPLSFHEKFSELLEKDFSYFIARLNGEVLCAAIITHVNGMMNYHLSGSSATARGIPAMNLLLYKTMEWGKERGYKVFNLGGGVGAKEDSLFKFKKSFTKEPAEQFSLLTKILNRSVYEELIKQQEIKHSDVKESSFFPLYRAPQK